MNLLNMINKARLIKYQLFYLILLFLLSCSSPATEEKSTSKTTQKVDAVSMPTQTANAVWKAWINNGFIASQNLYSAGAISIFKNGKIYAGSIAIEKHYQALDFKLDSVRSIQKILAHQERQIYYEINSFWTKARQQYKQIAIWKKEKAQWHKDFEFTAAATEVNKQDILEKLKQRRADWMQLCNAHHAQKLVDELYSEKAIYYNHKPLVIGREALTKEYQYMNRAEYQLSLQPMVIECVQEDLVFEIGQCTGSYGGKYILIWKKDEFDQWNIFVDSNI